ncbi:penicillin-binding protein activator LpoB [Morganella morganii]|uniref:Penicillin-binding protein activator LpoB n=1 Tax=Morganella morganii TaxID=582 RepID=A0A433ZT37_MORMO|nr:penicillin-binding protein activator LpoB [Morganella morganii]RUT65294.1 penicillin-binding protein activator LpoB [Morganella morganii]
MKRLLCVIASVWLLAGCPSVAPVTPPAPVDTVTPPPADTTPPLPPSDTVPVPPKMKKIEWEQRITPLVNQMVHSDGVNQGSTLLVNKVGNKTNSSLQTSAATGALMNTIGKTGVLNVIPAGAVSSAMSVLGMGDNDTLTLRSKAIGLARYLNAEYVLYSVVTGTRDARQMEMQLMSVSSGEIIWSGKGAVLEQ